MTDENIDDAKGRIKEAAGALSGNQRLKNEGRADQARSSAKKVANTVIDALTSSKKHGR